MKNLFFCLIFTSVMLSARADLPPMNYPYTLLSKNSQFQIRSIPYRLFGETGKSYIYDVVTKKELYKTDFYFDKETFLSNNGHNITSVSYWGWQGDKDNIEGYALCFYTKGKLVKRYKITDLVKNRENLLYTVSHVIWKYESDEMFPDRTNGDAKVDDSLKQTIMNNNAYHVNDTLYVTTIEKKLFAFDMQTGKIISTGDAVSFFKEKGRQFKQANQSKKSFPNFKFPPGEIPSFLYGRESFSNSLNELMTYKPTSNSYYCDIMVRLELGIDKETGAFEIAELNVYRNSKDKPMEFTELEKPKQKVLNWLKGKKFQTKDFPDWVEKWYVLDEYYYTYQ